MGRLSDARNRKRERISAQRDGRERFGSSSERVAHERHWRGRLADSQKLDRQGLPNHKLLRHHTTEGIIAKLFSAPEAPDEPIMAERTTADPYKFSGNVVGDAALKLMTSLALGGTIATSPLGVAENKRALGRLAEIGERTT